jgi:predicted RNA-binding Zn ribbon-like protein
MRAERVAPAPLSLSPEKPLLFVGGDPSVDFVNTVDWTTRGLEFERLTDYERLVEWAVATGMVSRIDAQRLRREARASPKGAKAAHRSAMWARSVLRRLFFATSTGNRRREALADFNELLGDSLARMRLEEPIESRATRETPPALVRSWQDMGEDLDSLLWPVIWHASVLLSSADIKRLRVCAAKDCGWMYVDRSRNGLRRWCRMESCGTREKNRRRAR